MKNGSNTATVLSDLEKVRDWQEDLYRDLHQHPELSHQEHRTAGVVVDRLRSFGLDIHDGIGGTGVVGILRNGDGPTILLRSEIDALPVKEQTGLPYASTATATDQNGMKVPVMHACGHDIHMTLSARCGRPVGRVARRLERNRGGVVPARRRAG